MGSCTGLDTDRVIEYHTRFGLVSFRLADLKGKHRFPEGVEGSRDFGSVLEEIDGSAEFKQNLATLLSNKYRHRFVLKHREIKARLTREAKPAPPEKEQSALAMRLREFRETPSIYPLNRLHELVMERGLQLDFMLHGGVQLLLEVL
jgi:hypothetical protein